MHVLCNGSNCCVAKENFRLTMVEVDDKSILLCKFLRSSIYRCDESRTSVISFTSPAWLPTATWINELTSTSTRCWTLWLSGGRIGVTTTTQTCSVIIHRCSYVTVSRFIVCNLTIHQLKSNADVMYMRCALSYRLQCSAQVLKRAGCHLKRAHLVR